MTKPRIIYPKRNRKLMERLNTPWLALVALIGFIALSVHAYPNEAYGNYSDEDKAALNALYESLEQPMDAHAAMVYLYTDEGDVK